MEASKQVKTMFRKLWLNFSILFSLRPLVTSIGVWLVFFFGIIGLSLWLAENDTQKGVGAVVGFIVAMGMGFISYRRAENFGRNIPPVKKK